MYRRQQRSYHASADINMDTASSVIPQYLLQLAAPPSTHAPGRRGQASSRRANNPYAAPSAEMRKAMKMRRRKLEDWGNMSVSQIVQQNPGLSVKEFVAELNVQKRLAEMKRAKAEQEKIAKLGILNQHPVIIPVITGDDATEIVEENPEDVALEAEARRRLIEETDGDFEDPPPREEVVISPAQGIVGATDTPDPTKQESRFAPEPTTALPSIATPTVPPQPKEHHFANAAPCPSPIAEPPANEAATAPVEDHTTDPVESASPSDSHKGNQLNEPTSAVPDSYPFVATPEVPSMSGPAFLPSASSSPGPPATGFSSTPSMSGPAFLPPAFSFPPTAATTDFSSPPQPPCAVFPGSSWASSSTVFPAAAPVDTQSFTMSGPTPMAEPSWANLWNPSFPLAAPLATPVQPRPAPPTTEEMFATATAFWHDMACSVAQTPRPMIVVPAEPTRPVVTPAEPQGSERVRELLRSAVWRPELVAPRPPRLRPGLGIHKPKSSALRSPYRPEKRTPTARTADSQADAGLSTRSGNHRSNPSRTDLEAVGPKRKLDKDDDLTSQPPEPKRQRGVWRAPTQTWDEWWECVDAPRVPPTPVMNPTIPVERVLPPRRTSTPKRREPPAPPPAPRARALPASRRRYDPIEVKKRPSYFDRIREGFAKVRSFVTGS